MGDGFITRFSFSISLISDPSSTAGGLLSSVLSIRLSMVNPAFLRGLLGVGVVEVHVVGVVDSDGGCCWGPWGTLFLRAKKSMGGIIWGVGGSMWLL